MVSAAETERWSTASRLGPNACTETRTVARSAGYQARCSPWTEMIVGVLVSVTLCIV